MWQDLQLHVLVPNPYLPLICIHCTLLLIRNVFQKITDTLIICCNFNSICLIYLKCIAFNKLDNITCRCHCDYCSRFNLQIIQTP